MANQAAVTIPMNQVKKIQIYVTHGKKTLAQVKSATGADYIMNGTLYNMKTMKINCHCKVDGKVLCKPDYSVRGFAWNDGPDIAMKILPNVTEKNYIACTPLIYNNHVKVPDMNYDPGQGGKRGRTALGIKDGRLALYCTKDGTSAARTPEQLQTDLYNAGWDYAIMLDGGGSSQCDFNGTKVTSPDGRKVDHWILVYTTSSGTTTNPNNPGTTTNPYTMPSSNISYGQSGTGVKWLQWELVNTFGYSIDIDGIFGNDTKNAVISLQKANGLSADGIVGKDTKAVITKTTSSSGSGSSGSTTVSCPYTMPSGLISYGQSGNGVRWLQWMLRNKFGYGEVTVDGIFGAKTLSAVKDLQKKNNLSVDGIVGTNTKVIINK